MKLGKRVCDYTKVINTTNDVTDHVSEIASHLDPLLLVVRWVTALDIVIHWTHRMDHTLARQGCLCVGEVC